MKNMAMCKSVVCITVWAVDSRLFVLWPSEAQTSATVPLWTTV
jgi:hypothetical protein